MKSPNKLGHVVISTPNVERARVWYCEVLGARVVYERLPVLSFVAYDDEHHRLGFSQATGAPVDRKGTALHHIAFFLDSVRDLLRNYVELKDKGILPTYGINHGTVLSLYYSDPDGNGVEFGVDRFPNAEEAQVFIDANFDRNPIGVSIDPNKLVAMMAAGASDEELLFYDYDAPMAAPKRLQDALSDDRPR